MSKPPGTCIFCGRTGVSKEHLWANWMRDHLPEFAKTATATNLRMQIGPNWRSLEQIYETSKVSMGAITSPMTSECLLRIDDLIEHEATRRPARIQLTDMDE